MFVLYDISNVYVCGHALPLWNGKPRHDGRGSSSDRERLNALERENRELRRANEILRKASAFFAQAELDRPLKKW